MPHAKAVDCQIKALESLAELQLAIAQFPDYDVSRDLGSCFQMFRNHVVARLEEAVALELQMDEYNASL